METYTLVCKNKSSVETAIKKVRAISRNLGREIEVAKHLWTTSFTFGATNEFQKALKRSRVLRRHRVEIKTGTEASFWNAMESEMY